jgi:hypothetical protein
MVMGMVIKASLVLGDGGGVFVHPRDDCFQLAVGFGQVYVEVGQGGEDLIVEILFAHIGTPWVEMGEDEDTSRLQQQEETVGNGQKRRNRIDVGVRVDRSSRNRGVHELLRVPGNH